MRRSPDNRPSAKPLRRGRCRIAAALALTLCGATDGVLQPGLWEQRADPGVATLDGAALGDLPLGEIKVQRVCLTPREAGDPAAWLARDVAEDCTLTQQSVAGGRIELAGTCREVQEGTVRIAGSYDAQRYAVDFTTQSRSSAGLMTFSGTVTGRRIGDCPDAEKEGAPR